MIWIILDKAPTCFQMRVVVGIIGIHEGFNVAIDRKVGNSADWDTIK